MYSWTRTSTMTRSACDSHAWRGSIMEVPVSKKRGLEHLDEYEPKPAKHLRSLHDRMSDRRLVVILEGASLETVKVKSPPGVWVSCLLRQPPTSTHVHVVYNKWSYRHVCVCLFSSRWEKHLSCWTATSTKTWSLRVAGIQETSDQTSHIRYWEHVPASGRDNTLGTVPFSRSLNHRSAITWFKRSKMKISSKTHLVFVCECVREAPMQCIDFLF